MITELLTKYVSTKQKKWLHDRSLSVGASEIGQCARKIYYLKKDTKHDAHASLISWGATHRGNMIEQHLVVPALEARFGKNLLFAGEDQTTFKEGSLSATPDGLITNVKPDILKHLGVKDIGSNCILVEIKSIDPRANLDKEKTVHRIQTIAQLGLVRSQSEYEPNYALIIYVDASFHDNVKEYAVEFDPAIFSTLQHRAHHILSAKSDQDIRPEGYINGGSECDLCPWKDTCGIARHTLPSETFKTKPVDPQRVAEMTDLCREALDLEAQASELKAAVEEKKEEIRERLRQWNINKVPGVVSWTQVKGRTLYDHEKLREAASRAGIDVTRFERVGASHSSLRINISGK